VPDAETKRGEKLHVVVDRDVCQTFGRCAFYAPSVFHLTEEGELEYDTSPSGSVRGAVEEAVDSCPTGAITLAD
jgi:ferredoxin